MQHTFLTPSDPRWSRFLSRARHDLYHLPGYARVAAESEGGRPLAFLAEHEGMRMFVPLAIRPVRIRGVESPGLFDVVSPYGYACPLVSSEGRTLAELHSFIREATEQCFMRFAARVWSPPLSGSTP